jgi:hypothetical protein
MSVEPDTAAAQKILRIARAGFSRRIDDGAEKPGSARDQARTKFIRFARKWGF